MKQSIKVFLVAFLLWGGLGAQTLNVEREIKKLETKGVPFFLNPEIDQLTQVWAKNDGGNTSVVIGRYNHYKPMIDKVRSKYGLPWFVALIPAANTGFEPKFRDENGNAGMWPLPYLMAKRYGIRLTSLDDQRRDPEVSTVAACQYLKDLFVIYQDWLKVITAFRIGPARLNQIIHGAGTTDFNIIYATLEPSEKTAIIQFYAAAVAISFGIESGQIPEDQFQELPSDTVTGIEQNIPFNIFKDRFKVPVEQMRDLNPSLQSDIVPFIGSLQTFRLPKSVATSYRRKRDSVSIWVNTKPIVPIKYDTLMEVVDDDTVIIIKTPNDGIVVENTIIPKTQAEQKVWVYYKIKRGDALFTLTDIFDCTAQQMRSWNGVKGNYIVVGKTLKFYVPVGKVQYYKRMNSLNLIEKRAIADQD